MAEPTRPAGDPEDAERATDAPTRARAPRDGLLAPPTDDELAATGEPTADEIHAAASGNRARPDGADDDSVADTRVLPTPAAESARAEDTEVIRPAETQVIRPAAEDRDAARDEPAAGERAAAPAAVAASGAAASAAAAPEPAPTRQPVLAPAEDDAPPAPKRGGNRLVATAWVLLAAGLFEVLYFAAVALLELIIAGPNAVAGQLQALIETKGAVFAWLPVLFFFLFFELTVLLLNRAGRFAYVVASAVVGLLVYVVSAILVPLVIAGQFADRNTALQAFLSPAFILILIVAREVMLWTGFAIGARGTRVRRRNKEARARYDQEVADARD
ncbi:hypothetical protein [Amnibacterium kyonggiense]|uniref:Uncharacterized protein n=1 Tax=Amnibacterium kyonggiense TaxID=595671 RepID=A0A4R7FQS6_9MICO|nr:hypothetical protein [Amnibacterium kyonggiense]TDS80113.1 hypothetical protein CLV52_0666 [Amnibacterium kyonggiense]